MVQQQIGSQVGGGTLADPKMIGEGEDGKSGISAAAFAATKDMNSLATAVKSINPLLGNYYTDAKLNGMTKNDLIFVVNNNQDAVEGASIASAAWAVSKAYKIGQRVTVSGGTLQAKNAGTSGSGSAPTNPGSVGGTVEDNDITWVRIS